MHLITLNYRLLPVTFSRWWSSLPTVIPEGCSSCSLLRKTGCACWYEEFKLDSSIWWVSTNSELAYPLPLIFTLCFFVDLSPLGLAGELAWQPESGVKGSCWDEKDSSTERLLSGTRSLAVLSWRGDSEVGAGVAGSVLSESGLLSPDTRAVESPEPGASERTPLSRCCSSIIFFKYLPWASIRNCSCLCTCCTLKLVKLHTYVLGLSQPLMPQYICYRTFQQVDFEYIISST